MEIGWHIIPSDSSVCPIDSASPQQPFFLIIKTYGAGQTCVWTGHPRELETGSHSMKEVNPDADGDWEFYLDGDFLGDGSTTWSNGWTVVNAEHHDCCSDSAHADFDAIKYINDSGAHAWTSSACFVDTSTKYDGAKVNGNPDHIRVTRPSSMTC
jgi:hypothetical protein